MRHLSLPARLLRPVLHLARRLSADNRGNVLMIMGFAIVPMIFAVGFGIDYSRAMKLQTQINAAADAATLSVVSATAMQQSQGSLSNAQFQAQLIAQMEANFAAQTGNLTGLSGSIAYGSGTTVTLTGTLNNGRTAVLNWTAQSKNVFAGILGASTLTISGTSSAGATGAPYINFYLMLDNSPSMLLPSTSAGLSAIATATSATTNAPYGCEFACHEQNPNGGKPYVYNGSTSIFLLSNYYSSGTTTNYYKVNTSTGAVYNSSGSQLSGYLYCSSSGGVYQATRCGSGWGGTQASS
ncbi:MAG TPA: TadE/TadG family type IV pilus assembly protein, partial [Novosphingobium sp.]|nr:TadE/TadG family type IV pilus assembly protein [Novosphingobium sp.]